jgi:Flp pilus assembly protein TadB
MIMLLEIALGLFLAWMVFSLVVVAFIKLFEAPANWRRERQRRRNARAERIKAAATH